MDYSENILDHAKHPRNFGQLAGAELVIREANASCGDMVEVGVTFDKGKVAKVGWRGVGCVISTAAASMLSEKIIGMGKADLLSLGEKGVSEMLGGIGLGRMKCATLFYRAMSKIFDGKN